jgi:hypothetical protein
VLKLIDNQLKKLACNQTQAFFSKGDWQLYHLLEWLLNQTGESDLFISSYSVSDEFLRQLNRMQKANLINTCAVLLDYRTARKALRLSLFTANIADEVLLGNNHSKIILAKNDSWRISVVTSQNQTRGNRYEAGMISTEPDIYDTLWKEIASIKQDCINGTELFRRNNSKN